MFPLTPGISGLMCICIYSLCLPGDFPSLTKIHLKLYKLHLFKMSYGHNVGSMFEVPRGRVTHEEKHALCRATKHPRLMFQSILTQTIISFVLLKHMVTRASMPNKTVRLPMHPIEKKQWARHLFYLGFRTGRRRTHGAWQFPNCTTFLEA